MSIDPVESVAFELMPAFGADIFDLSSSALW
jgi:hypothetical protein